MKILMLENHPHFADAVIKQFLHEHDVLVAQKINEAKQIISKESFDLILSDFDLDDGKGDEFVKYLRMQSIETPVIDISSHKNGNDKLIGAGANIICSKMKFKEIQGIISKFKI